MIEQAYQGAAGYASRPAAVPHRETGRAGAVHLNVAAVPGDPRRRAARDSLGPSRRTRSRRSCSVRGSQAGWGIGRASVKEFGCAHP